MQYDRWKTRDSNFSVLTSCGALTSVTRGKNHDYNDALFFEFDSGRKFVLSHLQDCCESVSLEDVAGDLDDLVGFPLTVAEESVSSENGPKPDEDYVDEFYTWTFYLLAGPRGSVTLRWYGSSNGYYSESVQLLEILG